MIIEQVHKAAIIVAPNGARKTRQDHPAVPITVEQIVQDVIACRDAGAAMVHLHARDKNGLHSLEINDNIKTLTAVKQAVGESIIVQLTTEAVGQYQPEQQMLLIKETLPEAASFALKELIPNDSYLSVAQQFFHWVEESGIIAQYILYSVEDVQRYFSLIKQGVLPSKNHHILLVLGRYHKQLRSSATDLAPFLNEQLLTVKTRWATCAFGPEEQQCLVSAMLMGGDVRVGFENNHFNSKGEIADSNAQQIIDIKVVSSLLNIDLHNADSFRQILRSQ
ncbi:3-keto-5-aminohexanoate cleavage protein [Psychromonas sp. 14N.309.X.WAT.B.A12]|uniref:3-keto-5-aminohexanoate cleavage protein n=1 Tax=unclassified Psychromonas TaxID=2614957 RepID=UPI0025B0AD08|nr:3-keto-5-aminohexanoate cleavage protein [Psychromonas sp. 14N.309.X.WAT.B.A12]MDN2664589.1 3-keto-5-aminohexanoate cleavage protein [Psychromonas sp. 14N.309.X.WAT.B.A12]